MPMNWLIDKLWFRRFRRLPHFRSPAMLELPDRARVLVFAPHPDDEWIGCGGTLAKLVQNDCAIRVVIVTDGAQGDPECRFAGNVSEMRRRETTGVLNALGIHDVSFLDYPDGELGSQAKFLVEAVAEVYDEYAPDWVLTTSLGEHHRDHVCTGYIVMRHWLKSGARERLFAYEIYGSIRLDWLVDISQVMNLKRKLLQRYVIPLSYVDYEAACVSMARFRGVLLGTPSQKCMAEGFMEIRRRDAWFFSLAGLLWVQA